MRDLLDGIISILGIIGLSIAITVIIMFGVDRLANKHDNKLWNDGHCDVCGGTWQYEQAVGHRFSTAYIYICDECGKRIEINEVR